MLLLVILIVLGLICFIKLDTKGFTRLGFMVAYLALVIMILEFIY